MLKAYFTKEQEDTAPYTHNLKSLANRRNIYSAFSENHKDLIDELLPLNIEVRYPTHKERLLKTLNHAKCKLLIEETKELCNWIRTQL